MRRGLALTGLVVGAACWAVSSMAADVRTARSVPSAVPGGHLISSPDGRSVYAQHVDYDSDGSVASDVLEVFARSKKGSLRHVECLAGVNAASAPAGCRHVLPPGLETMVLSPAGTTLYLAGHRQQVGPPIGIFAKLARNPRTGTLTVTDCLAGAAHGDQPGCRTDAKLESLPQLTLVAQDVYAYSGGRLIDFRPGPNKGELVERSVLDVSGLGQITASPNGRQLYALKTTGPGVVTIPRNPATGRLGQPATSRR